MNQGPYRQPPPFLAPPHSGLAIAAFVVALTGFLAGIIPFVGFVGTIGLVLAVVDLSKKDVPPAVKRHGFAVAGAILGSLATLGAIAWVIAVYSFEKAAAKGSCPHLYSFDGEEYRLDADLVSGALYRGAEREDMDRLESLREVNGAYRVRIQNDLEEVDVVDSLALVVVDAPEGVEALPTPSGDVVGVRAAAAPLSTVKESFTRRGDPRERWTLDFGGRRGSAILVVHGRTSPFAEDAFVRYMATMGQGVRPLLEWRTDDDCKCSKEYLDAEMDRLGLPLAVSTGAWKTSLGPIGPAIPRAQAIRIELPEGERAVVRLETTPRFWQIDAVELASEAPLPEPRVLTPIGSSQLAAPDGDRVVLRPGDHVDVAFAAPPAPTPGTKRTVIAHMRGYYDLDIGGTTGINVPRMIGHRLGVTSLPRFAAGL